MSVNFLVAKCHTYSSRKLFGLCDNPPPANDPAYIDELDGSKWIAVVVNEANYDVRFTAIDKCIDTLKADGKMDKRCEGFLFYNSTVIFVELKEKGAKGNDWVVDAEQQVRTSIGYFEASDNADENYKKKAYLCNSQHPKFKSTQINRMDKFLTETGYVLRIENRIILD